MLLLNSPCNPYYSLGSLRHQIWGLMEFLKIMRLSKNPRDKEWSTPGTGATTLSLWFTEPSWSRPSHLVSPSYTPAAPLDWSVLMHLNFAASFRQCSSSWHLQDLHGLLPVSTLCSLCWTVRSKNVLFWWHFCRGLLTIMLMGHKL